MNDQNNSSPVAEPTAPPDPAVTPSTPNELPAPAQPELQAATSQPVPPATPTNPTSPNPATPPVPNGAPIPVQAPQGKRSLLWLWVTIGIVVLAGIVAGLVLFTSKQSADKVAQEYTAASTTYVTSVHDSVQNSDSIADAKTDLEKVMKDKPVLKQVFLSDLSSEYAKAKTLETSVDKKVNDFSTGISGLANLDAFITDNREQYSDITLAVSNVKAAQTRAATVAAMEKVLTIFETAQKTVSDTQFPAELSDTKKDLVGVYKAEILHWKAMITALEESNSAAYDKAYAQFQEASDKESISFVRINSYFYQIPTKQRDLLEKLQSSHDTSA